MTDNAPRIIRTMAFVPAHDEDTIIAAAESGLDALGMDMEDLTPRNEKQRARDIFPTVAKELIARGVLVMARTNGLGEGCEEDLAAIVGADLHCANIPKTESADDVVQFCRLLDKAESANGVPAGHTLVRPVIETAAGVRFAYEIAAASPRVTYMGGVAGSRWGDLGATVGVIEYDGTESLYLRSKVLNDVRAAGVKFPIGGGSSIRKDVEGIRAFAIQNKHIGYTGSYCSPSPEVVAVINDVFTPTGAEVAEWRELVPILEAAQGEGKVAFRANGRTLDTAALGWIRDKLELAERLGLVNA